MTVVKKFRIKSFKIKQKEIIEFKNISLSFNNRKILDSISFSIYQNQIVGLLGPNGVGKSTIFNLIIGLLKPQSGLIEINSEKLIHIQFIQDQIILKLVMFHNMEDIFTI